MRKSFLIIVIAFGIALLTQSFQCSSPEMTTAKIAYNNRDWQKASTYLDKELTKNPTNGEAWFYLAQVKQNNNDVQGAAKAILEADKYLQDPKLKELASNFKNSLWVLCYNQGIELFNQGFTQNKKNLFESAIKQFQTGLIIKPELADFYQLTGGAQEALGDTAKAMESYAKYTEILTPELNFAKEKGVYIGLNRNDVINKIGAPASSKGIRFNPRADSIVIDRFSVNGKEAYVYYTDKANDRAFKVTGWRFNPPTKWSSAEKEQPQAFFLGAFINSANYYYMKKDYEKAAQNLMYVLTFEPTNSEANNFLVALYEEQGKSDKAFEYIQNLIKTDPKNKNYRASYADMLLKKEKYDEAINEYKEALKLDKDFHEAKINIAVSLKNKVVLIQRKQQELISQDKTKKMDPQEYTPLLLESAKYFEEAKKNSKYINNYQIIFELAEVYYVLNDQVNLKLTVADLESLELIVPDEQKENYFIKLIRVYDQMIKNPEKSAIYQQKYESLEKKK